MKVFKIPEATVSRLSVYSRYLSKVDKTGVFTIASSDIAKGVGVSAAQVRKDLAYFGEFGTRGVGYNVQELNHHILRILGLNQEWSVVMIGAGNLGRALCLYDGFRDRGFNIVAMFDVDSSKIGKKVEGVPIFSLDKLTEVVEDNNIKIGIVAVPSEHAQEAANLLIQNNISAILNFAPAVINVADDINLRNVDLSVNLEILTFNIINKFDE